MRRLILAGLLICLCGAVAAASAQLLTTHAGTAIPAGGGGGGGTIAFVNAVDGGNNGGSTNSLTYSYTATTGPHSLLVVCVAGDTSADDVTGVTYNSLPMTLAVKSIGTPTLRYTYIYYLVAASGWGGTSHSVVVSASTTHYLLSVIGEYSGVSQSSPFDASAQGQNASGSTVSYDITTIANNVWLMTCGATNFPPITPSTNTDNLRVNTGTYWNPTLLDHGAPITPAGTETIGVNGGGGRVMGVTASFAPG